MRRFWKLENWPQCKGYSLCKMVSLGQKIKLPKTCKNLSTSTLQTFYAKNSSKKQLIFEKWDDFENWKNRDNAKAIAFEKWSIWVKKLNCLKHVKNSSISTLQTFYAKNGFKKQLIFEKWDDFENWKKIATMQRL